MSKSKSAVTGKYVSAKAAKAKPETTFKSDDYPARQLRKLIRMLEKEEILDLWLASDSARLVANIKKRMGWSKPRKAKPTASRSIPPTTRRVM